MVTVALGWELCPAAGAFHCQAGGGTDGQTRGLGVTLGTGPNLLFSLPFPRMSSCSRDRPRAFSASPCHPSTSSCPHFC